MCDMTYNVLNDSKIGEAPKDGKAYGRKNGSWAEMILAGGMEEIDYRDIDNYLQTGMVIVNDVKDVLSYPRSGVRHFDKHLLICSADYDIWDNSGNGDFVQDSDYRYTQTLICADGSIKKRRYEYYVWSEWENVSAGTDYVDEKIGDIDTALDGIIALQNSLTGGDGV